MEQQFSPEQQQFLLTQLPHYIEQLTLTIQRAISAMEAEANAAFIAQGIVFSTHSPANADYLTASVLDNLFDTLHGGDRAVAAHILTMQAKRLGIALHVDGAD